VTNEKVYSRSCDAVPLFFSYGRGINADVLLREEPAEEVQVYAASRYGEQYGMSARVRRRLDELLRFPFIQSLHHTHFSSKRCVAQTPRLFAQRRRNDKSQAESLAKSPAGVQVVADQIAVIPVGAEKEAKAVNSDLDQGIEKNLDAALIQNKLHKSVKYEVKNGVVTLTGEVNSEDKRTRAEKVATGVPNVTQVVNNLQVKNQKASSSQ